jgi:GT2 family glycosyltransferase
MNSDVLPKNGEWLDKMLAIASSDDAGIVGARLLFEDNTIQHDGMAPMTLAEYPGLLFNDHPRKGWPKGLVKNTNPVAPCDLLTAACWVMKKSLFEQLDGFDPIYVLGDFEDSDLCLKTLALGKTNYIRRDVELYHLERQSQNLVSSGGWKHNLTILNAVTFNQRWNDELQALDKELQSNG